jgi:hypothetical protein
VSNYRPGPQRPKSSSQLQFEAMQRRIGQRFGEFGDREAAAEDVDPFDDNHLKPTLGIIAGLFVVSAAVTYTIGTQSRILNIVAALVVGGLLSHALTRYPVHISARHFLAAALFLEAATDIPTFWKPPLAFADVAFYASLKDFAGVPGMSLPFFFFGALYLLYRARRETRRNEDIVPPPKQAMNLLTAFLVAVVALEAFGLARGGNLQPSFFQILHLLTLPIVAMAFLYAFRGTEDLPAIGTIIVAVAVARSALCFGTYFLLAWKFRTEEGFFVTTHADTVLFSTAIFCLIAYAIEDRQRRVVTRCLALAAAVFVGVALNNRRLAFVSLGAAPAMMYLSLKPSATKAKVTRAAFVVAGLVLAYTIVGSQAEGDSPLWKPAKLAMSVLDQKDNSSESRDIENYNLIYTMSQSPIVGTGFGWEYKEKLLVYDISKLFALYRYIAHNGVLWIWSVGGVVGFTALWVIYPATMTLGIRAYRTAEQPVERAAALASIGVVVATLAQIWGDQGWNSYLTLILFSLAFATAARLEAKGQDAPA